MFAQELKFGPCSERYFPKYPRLSRDVLREIAASTLDALDDGFYYPPATKDDVLIVVEQTGEGKETETGATKEEEGRESEKKGKEDEDGDNDKGDKQSEAEVATADDEKSHPEVQKEVTIADYRKAGREPYDLKTTIWNTNVHTLFIAPEDETIGLWFEAEKSGEEKKNSRILIGEYSTLYGSRKLKEITQDEDGPKGKIGVLNYASAKKPGGGFLNGAQAQVRIPLFFTFLLSILNLKFNRKNRWLDQALSTPLCSRQLPNIYTDFILQTPIMPFIRMPWFIHRPSSFSGRTMEIGQPPSRSISSQVQQSMPET